MENHLYTQQWISLSWEIKFFLQKALNISRSGTTHTIDNQVAEDGFLPKDLAVVDVPCLQTYLGSKEKDFLTLWKATIAKAEAAISPMPAVLSPEEAKQFQAEYEARQKEKGQPINIPSNVQPKKSPKRKSK